MIVVVNKEKLREDIARAGFSITSLAKKYLFVFILFTNFNIYTII